MSFTKRIYIIRSVSDDDLKVAYERWCLALRYGISLLCKYLGKSPDIGALKIIWRVSTHIAPWCMLALIQGARSEYAAKIEIAESIIAAGETKDSNLVAAELRDALLEPT